MSWFRRPVARVAINMRPVRASWGGGNQWLVQLTRFLRACGYAVSCALDGRVDVILLAHASRSNAVTFWPEEIRAYRSRHPQVRCVHRVNENDQRKGTAHMDGLQAAANAQADYTVFISQWLRDYHAARWFDARRPHTAIVNGADPRSFHPFGSALFRPEGVLRLVTHHWSDHWMKGFAVYQEIDRLIAAGELPKTELWVIGRWPTDIRWQAARTFQPVTGARLATLLRACHVYVTASQWEPGGMHFIEGAQCGLPVLYHLDGGGIVEVAARFGLGFREDIRPAIMAMRERYPALRQAVLRDAPSGDAMCLAYERVIRQVLLGRPEAGLQLVEQVT